MSTFFTEPFDYNVFNLETQELFEDSPRADQPCNVNITLKAHQLALLQKCLEVERGPIMLHSCFPEQTHPDDHITTRLGIIGDQVGSGKSYVILSLVQNRQLQEEDNTVTRSLGNNMVICKTKETHRNVGTNVLVIPHNLTSQWVNYITKWSSNLKYILINKKTFADLLEDKINIEEYDLIVVTATYYNRFAAYTTEADLRLNRVFFDEVDNLNMPSCKNIYARFIWLVTASYGNVLYPRGFTKWDANVHRYVWCASGITNAGFIKNILLDVCGNLPMNLTRLLIIKNSESFIARSNNLPGLVKHFVKCKTPNAIRVLNGIVDRNIMECLNGDDIQGAINYVNPQNKGSEDNIIDVLIQKYNKTIKNLTVKLQYTRDYIFDTQQEQQAEIQRINSKITENEEKIRQIRERIQVADMCYICYDNLDNKTVTRCCQNSFCFKCLNMWLARKNVCPLCKAALVQDDLLCVLKSSDANIPLIPDEDHEVEDCSEHHDKHKNVGNLLSKRKQGDKFLIFSNFDTSFVPLYPILNDLNVKYAHLKGNGNVIKCMVDNYRNGDVDVLLVNSRHYGSGLNLENTTDVVMFHKFDVEIEKQVIGRAHRLGRTQPLNVWYYLYENEMTTIA